MGSYQETEQLKAFAEQYRSFEQTRDLAELEDLDVYLYSIRSRFIQKENFPTHFAQGYDLVRKGAEEYEMQHKKYSREKYIHEEGDNTEY